MKECNDKKYNDSYTLYDVFSVGDRVKQIYYDSNGTKREYMGIIKKIQKHCIAVHWNTINGTPLSDMQIVYNILHEYEVFNGKDNTSPIIKEQKW